MPKKKKELEGPPCLKCSTPQVEKILTIIEAHCWSCGSEMKVSYIVTDPLAMLRGHTSVPPSYFTAEEIDFARNKGVELKEHHSNAMEKSYLANSCSSCGTFCGDSFLFEDYILPAYNGEYKSENYRIGLACPTCEDLPHSSE